MRLAAERQTERLWRRSRDRSENEFETGSTRRSPDRSLSGSGGGACSLVAAQATVRLVRDLAELISDYAVALRMGELPDRAIELALHEALTELRRELGSISTIDRAMATLLTELVVAAWPAATTFPLGVQEAVFTSVAHVSEAVMSVLTASPMPGPPPAAGGQANRTTG